MLQQGESVPGRLLRLWYDREGNYLEVIFDQKEGYFRETENDSIMARVDVDDNILGFSILKFSSITSRPIEFRLQ